MRMLAALFRLGYIPKRKGFGHFPNSSNIQLPVLISNPKNVFINEDVSIGPNAVLYATNAPITFGNHFMSGPELKILTGNHERRIGRFAKSIKESEKNKELHLDRPVFIQEDVWCGVGVTILSGCTIGRGCSIGAGSVVTKSTPPYSIVVGVPARFVRFYWTIEEIRAHEERLYPENERFSLDQLQALFSEYCE